MGQGFDDWLKNVQGWQSYYDQTHPAPYRTPGVQRPGGSPTSGNTNIYSNTRTNPAATAGSFESRLHTNDTVKNYMNQQFGQAPVDPFGGTGNNVYDLLAGIMGGSNGGGGGGGGGSNAAAQAAADKANAEAAFKASLAALLKQQDATNAGFDTRQKTIGDLSAAGQKKLAGILAEMKMGAASTGKGVGAAFAHGDALQAQLARQFAAQEAAQAAGQAKTLGAFGVGPSGIDRQYGASNLVNAQRAALAAAGTADQAMWAGMPGVAAALGSDVSTQNSQQSQALLAALAAARQKAAADAAQAQAQLEIQAAQAGVKVKP